MFAALDQTELRSRLFKKFKIINTTSLDASTCWCCCSENRREMALDEESHILIHALRDANVPKFLAEDVPLFESIMDDLFPGIKPPDPESGAIEVRLATVGVWRKEWNVCVCVSARN